MTIDKSTIDYSEKSLYTITTRSGDVFYLIINSSDGSVYFLNSVDTSDLTALLSEDSAKVGNEINQSAIDDMTATEAASDDEAVVTSKAENKSDSSSDMKSNLIFTAIIIGAVVVVCGIVALIKRKSGSKNAYDDDFFAAAEEVNEPASDVIPYNVEDDFEMDAEQIENPPEEKPVDETNSTATATYYNDEDDFEENDIY